MSTEHTVTTTKPCIQLGGKSFNGNHTKHFPIKLSAASHLATHPAFNSNALFLWELYAN